jgi:hypothetical protein
MERKCFASRSRFAFYDYLAVVFELYVQLRRTKQAKKAATRIAKLFQLRNQKRNHPIRVIIGATSTVDLMPKSSLLSIQRAGIQAASFTDVVGLVGLI